jgi:hypothetical protein
MQTLVKKTIHIVIAFILITGTSGIVVNKHFSHGELFSTSVYGKAQSCCTDKEMCSCCSTETEVYQVKDNFTLSSVEIPDVACLESLPAYINQDGILKQQQITAASIPLIQVHSPPGLDEFLSIIQVFII